MKYTTTTRRRPRSAAHRTRRLTVVGFSALSFAIATVDTAEAASDFVFDSNAAAGSQHTDH